METPANLPAPDSAGGGTARVRLTILGPFAATDDAGAPLALPTRKTAALLTHLALRAGTALRRDGLAAMLWSGRESEQALASLRKALAAIRNACGEDTIEADRATVTVRPEAIDVDARRFEECARDGRDLEAAASIWGGSPFSGLDLPDLPWRRWRDGEAARLNAIALDVLARIVAMEATDGPGDAAVAMARHMLEADPAAEAAHRLLMVRFAAEGQRSLALDQYEVCRRAFADLGAQPSEETEALRRALAGEAPARAPVSIEGKPAIAVLPFADRGGAGGYLCEGIAEDLIAALARLPWLTVIARGSSFAYRDRQTATRNIATDLGVRYILAGGVRKSDGLMRITGELSDAEAGAVLWADHVEGPAASVFGLQDDVVARVAGAIAPRLKLAEIERSLRKRADNLAAWDLHLRALSRFHDMTRVGHAEAMRLIAAALDADPSYAPALGLAAWIHALRVPQGWAEPADAERVGIQYAQRALAAGADDAEVQAMAGYALGFLGRSLERGLAATERAIELSPSTALGHSSSGWLHAYLGMHDVAVQRFRRALVLSPRDPLAFRSRAGLAFALLFSGQPAEALVEATRAQDSGPHFTPTHRVRCVALVALGRIDEARTVAAELSALVPGITVAYALAETRFVRPEDRALLAEGLRAAGLPP